MSSFLPILVSFLFWFPSYSGFLPIRFAFLFEFPSYSGYFPIQLHSRKTVAPVSRSYVQLSFRDLNVSLFSPSLVPSPTSF